MSGSTESVGKQPTQPIIAAHNCHNCFEMGPKLKRPSEIKPPLKVTMNWLPCFNQKFVMIPMLNFKNSGKLLMNRIQKKLRKNSNQISGIYQVLENQVWISLYSRELLTCAWLFFCTTVYRKASAKEISTLYKYFNQQVNSKKLWDWLKYLQWSFCQTVLQKQNLA